MSSSTLAIIGVFGAVWAVVQFCMKNHFEQLKNRRESGILFLTKINQCIAQTEYGIETTNDCICFESYSSFAINLSFEQAETLRWCWDDYLRCRGDKSASKEDFLRCLKCLELNVQENTEPYNLRESGIHFGHYLQLKAKGFLGTTKCPQCIEDHNSKKNT